MSTRNPLTDAAANSQAARLPGLEVPATGNAAMDRFLAAVAERLEVREGARGNPYERAVTVRDLEDIRRDQLTNQQALGLARVEASNAKTAARSDGTRARAESLQTLIRSNDQELMNVRSQLNGLKGSVMPADVAAIKDLRARESQILADRKEMTTELRSRVMPGLNDAL